MMFIGDAVVIETTIEKQGGGGGVDPPFNIAIAT